MKTSYRLVHYVPDPYSQGRWPIAAVVRRGGGQEVVRSSWLPGPACLGSRKAYATCELVLQSLRHVSAPDDLPMEVGSCVELGPETAVPRGVESVADWLRKYVLPSGSRTDGAARPRPTRRRKYGERFLQRWSVDRYVHPSFRPAKHLPDFRGRDGDHLPNISQWVRGASQLLLLEPLSPIRADVVEDAKRVWRDFAAYGYAIEHGRLPGVDAKMYAYVLGGGDARRRLDAIAEVRDEGWTVVDTANDAERDRFVSLVRDTGESATSAPTLPFSE